MPDPARPTVGGATAAAVDIVGASREPHRVSDAVATVVLCCAGPPGSGKSSVGAALAARLGWAVIDQDSATNPLMEQIALAAGVPFDLDAPRLRGAVRDARYACLTASPATTPGWASRRSSWRPSRRARDPDARGGSPRRRPGRLRLVLVDTPAVIRAARTAARGAARDLATRPAGPGAAEVPDPPGDGVLVVPGRRDAGGHRLHRSSTRYGSSTPPHRAPGRRDSRRSSSMTTQGPDRRITCRTSSRHSPSDPATRAGGRWADLPAHLAWLDDQLSALVRFSLSTVRAHGGFHYPAEPTARRSQDVSRAVPHRADDAHGLDRPPAGDPRGRPPSRPWRPVAAGGVHRPRARRFRQRVGDPRRRKTTYDQVHVGLAASSAVAAGHPDAATCSTRWPRSSTPTCGRPTRGCCASPSPPTGATARTTAEPTPPCTASRRSSPWAT